jgi:uncharacterized Zn-binding protein involved in type VI secretion
MPGSQLEHVNPEPLTVNPQTCPFQPDRKMLQIDVHSNTSETKMPPASRVSDMHTCPMVEPGPVPHVGGPILPPCCPTVLIGGLPAARVSDMLVCVGPPDVIAKGSATVLIGGLLAARMGDSTVHGGVIIMGEPTVMIGG